MEINQSVLSLVALEQECSEVYQVKYDGIHWWPFLRFAELERFKHNKYGSNNNPPRKSQQELVGIINKLKRYRLKTKLQRQIRALQSPAKIGFLSFGNSYYSESLVGKRYHRHIDPFLQKIEGSCIKLHFDIDVIDDLFYEAKYLPKNLISALSSYYYRDFKIELNTSLRTELKALGFNNIVDRSFFDFKYLIGSSKVAEIILRELKLEKLFVVCFYDLQIWPFVVAARKLGIDVIDIQHGKQGEFHHMYSHNQGMNEMAMTYPSYFWNWGKPSASSIQKWYERKSGMPICLIGGNLFTQKWINEEFYTPNDSELSFLIKRKNFSRCVLHCIDRIEEISGSKYAKVLDENPDILFAYRLHPSKRNKISEFKQVLNSRTNVTFDVPTLAPLYWLFKNVDCLITAWSSVCIEGLLFKLPTILIHLNGGLLYQEYVYKGHFQLNTDLVNFRDGLESLLSNRHNISSDYIMTDSSESINVLNQIVNG